MVRRTLVIETTTAACSVALIERGVVVARAHEVVGRGHAERLVPMIAGLPDGGRADHILVDCGPGSFTGIRVGIAAARGLALGWGASVGGFSALALVAAKAFAQRPSDDLAVVLEGGHGEVFMQVFAAPALALSAVSPAPSGVALPFVSLRPEAALVALGRSSAVGNGVRFVSALDATLDVTEMLPDAADAVLLPPACTALDPRPIYGRAPDAKPMAT